MSTLNISSFIWGIADDVLRDVYVRGKYRDVILPMTVIRRLDAVLEPTKDAVLSMKARLDDAGITNQDGALRQASGEAFYNTSSFRLRDLTSRGRQQQLRADFEAYLDGFSPNVQEVLGEVQVPQPDSDPGGSGRTRLLAGEVPRQLDQPQPQAHPERRRLGAAGGPGQPRHGYRFRRAHPALQRGEQRGSRGALHAKGRGAANGASHLPADCRRGKRSGTYLVYDGACGTGGMLTVAEETLTQLASERGKEASVHLYGQEVNPETYAISKADLILKGEGGEADNIQYGSTLSADAFPAREFDFMLSNPPYGKSWKTDLERMGGKSGMKDPRFVVEHDEDPEHSLITRSSDGQMMFLANMLSKMKWGDDAPMGSRIAEVHNGSSLFTGDAGQGESNIRRWIIENDWLEAIVALPA